eukprot:Rhum_TRINITY_DN14427_c5_g1::Rhum_TRINITY_DN14427_c5_g1_i1::g.89792::m.89792
MRLLPLENIDELCLLAETRQQLLFLALQPPHLVLQLRHCLLVLGLPCVLLRRLALRLPLPPLDLVERPLQPRLCRGRLRLRRLHALLQGGCLAFPAQKRVVRCLRLREGVVLGRLVLLDLCGEGCDDLRLLRGVGGRPLPVLLDALELQNRRLQLLLKRGDTRGRQRACRCRRRCRRRRRGGCLHLHRGCGRRRGRGTGSGCGGPRRWLRRGGGGGGDGGSGGVARRSSCRSAATLRDESHDLFGLAVDCAVLVRKFLLHAEQLLGKGAHGPCVRGCLASNRRGTRVCKVAIRRDNEVQIL